LKEGRCTPVAGSRVALPGSYRKRCCRGVRVNLGIVVDVT